MEVSDISVIRISLFHPQTFILFFQGEGTRAHRGGMLTPRPPTRVRTSSAMRTCCPTAAPCPRTSSAPRARRSWCRRWRRGRATRRSRTWTTARAPRAPTPPASTPSSCPLAASSSRPRRPRRTRRWGRQPPCPGPRPPVSCPRCPQYPRPRPRKQPRLSSCTLSLLSSLRPPASKILTPTPCLPITQVRPQISQSKGNSILSELLICNKIQALRPKQ